jgi:DNA-binding NarL/FixJ family response regulator
VEGRERSVTTSAEFLVVEDHPMVMRTLKTYLQRVGTVVEAGTVQEGLKAFEEHPNLAGMLVDVNLPDGLGTDLIREIRRRDPVLPILMLTGSDERGWPREVQVLTLSLGGTPRVALTDEMGVSDNTVKTTVRHLLRKTTADTLDDLVQYVMRAALHRRNVATSNVATNSAGTATGAMSPDNRELAARSSRPPARRAR